MALIRGLWCGTLIPFFLYHPLSQGWGAVAVTVAVSDSILYNMNGMLIQKWFEAQPVVLDGGIVTD